MSDTNNSGLGAFLAGFIIGSCVGAAVALVVAPQSGTHTRDQLMQKGQEWRGRANQYSSDALASVQQVSAQAQERMNIVLDEGRTRLVTMKNLPAEEDTPQE